MFGKQIAGAGALFTGVAGVMFFQAKDLEENYVKTSANIKTVAIDCYIEDARGKIVDKETDDLAYMDCALAPLVAQKHGYDAGDIHKRAQIEYIYLSPVDDNYYSGSFTRKNDVEDYAAGGEIQIFTHKTEPDKSKTPAGNVFLGDENV
jgi:hypothetical protein